MESHLCRQPSNCSGCHQCQGQGQSRCPVLGPWAGGALEPWASSALLRLQPGCQKITSFTHTHVTLIISSLHFPTDRSCWMMVGFSRFLYSNSSSSVGAAQTSGLLHDLPEGLSPCLAVPRALPLPQAAALQTQTGLPVGARWTCTQASNNLGMYTGSSAQLISKKGWRNLSLPPRPHPFLLLTKAKAAPQCIPACSIPRQGLAGK